MLTSDKKIDNFHGKYRFLSNFWDCKVKDDYGIEYPSTEHAYQAMKTPDREMRIKISQCSTPGQSKKLGKTVPLFDDWDSRKNDVMLFLLRQKFRPGTELANLLIATGDAELIEGNTWGDTYWGICKGVGENKLGILLMNIRSELVS